MRCGSCSLRRRVHRDASRKREQVVLAGSAESRPNSVFETIGKNEIMMHTKIAGVQSRSRRSSR